MLKSWEAFGEETVNGSPVMGETRWSTEAPLETERNGSSMYSGLSGDSDGKALGRWRADTVLGEES